MLRINAVVYMSCEARLYERLVNSGFVVLFTTLVSQAQLDRVLVDICFPKEAL